MDLSQLQQLADDFSSIDPSRFDELADACRDLAVNHLDVRYMVLGECFRLSSSFWGPGDGAAVSSAFANELRRVWVDYLPGVLRAGSEAGGTAVASALKEELSVLGANDPLRYQSD